MPFNPRRTPPGTILGQDSQAGSYVLRIELRIVHQLAFGRFKKGKVINLEAGEYLYIGSALGAGRSAATGLARRLVRHASRATDRPPHRIRAKLLDLFADHDLGPDNPLPTRPKTLFWNIDHLLDLPKAHLVEVFALRSPQRLEGPLGQILEADSHTTVFEKGLGANDVPGNTHILHVAAPEAWWDALPARIIQLAESHQG